MPRYPIIALCSTEILRAIAMEDGCRSLIGCKTEEKGKSLTQYHKQKRWNQEHTKLSRSGRTHC